KPVAQAPGDAGSTAFSSSILNPPPSILDPRSAILDPPSSIFNLPLSVAFQPLGSFHCIETATGLIAPELAVYHQPDHPASQEFRTPASALQQQLAPARSHTLLFTAVPARAVPPLPGLDAAYAWAKH